MRFVHHSAPTPCSVVIHNQFRAAYFGRWIGRAGSVARSLTSSDIKKPKLNLWGDLKSLSHETPVITLDDLTAWIATIVAVITITSDIFGQMRQ
ncbi:hypothetical protein CDAR_102881 [Caerostris darwini]|uniref:Uncharacterized protein n=1 Tax=Caerostris darwini TaxID=1538125 RepID=A0AAV4MIX4_9ARAC|nr:hypothetical protein CDAR_102881 [Caerostris darwini]